MQRTVIIDALKRTDFGAQINVRGWVRSRRGNKNVSFIALNDGSTIKNIQIVVDLSQFDEERLKPVTTGSCISATGTLVESQGSGQAVEIQLTDLEVYGTADAEKYTLDQFGLFMAVIRAVKEKGGIEFEIRHCANSGAVVNYPYMALDMVRPGYLLYGYGDPENRIGLRPCMRLLTTISTIKHYAPGTCVSYGRKFTTDRRMRVGVLAAGYADGLPRAASGKCSFKTAGGYARQIGSICMDMCMADLTDLPEAEVGSEVELFGPESDINKLAEAAGTIPYEILCSVTKRVPRIYKNLSD